MAGVGLRPIGFVVEAELFFRRAGRICIVLGTFGRLS